MKRAREENEAAPLGATTDATTTTPSETSLQTTKEEEGQPEPKRLKPEEDATSPVSSTGDAPQQQPKQKRLPKRKVAMLVGYRGTGYCGLQRFVTISFFCTTATNNNSLLFVPQGIQE